MGDTLFLSSSPDYFQDSAGAETPPPIRYHRAAAWGYIPVKAEVAPGDYPPSPTVYADGNDMDSL